MTPVVLVHGLMGFDRVQVGPLLLARYFPEIEEALTAAGRRVAVPRLSKTRGVAHRAAELKRFIDARFPDDRVHLIAHSMGGLDARHMITHLGMHERVRSLTTIGTPHRGSPFADWAIRRFGRVLKPMFHLWGIPTDAYDDLTVESCARFNATTPDMPGVAYHSVAGRCPRHQLPPQWWGTSFVVDAEGENDGIVSVESARYGESFEVWDGDHMHLVNRRNPRAAGWGHRPSDYLRLVSRLG